MSFVMAAQPDANLQRLQHKREAVRRMVYGALGPLVVFDIQVEYAFSRDSIVFMGQETLFYNRPKATTADWIWVLSEGLGVRCKVDWWYKHLDDEDLRTPLRVLRLGETIFCGMQSVGLNPEWNGTMEGDFMITAVDDVGAKLALATALNLRLGCDSLLSRVSSLALVLVASAGSEHSLRVEETASTHFRCLSDIRK